MMDLHTMAEELELAYEEYDCYDFDPDSIGERVFYIEDGISDRNFDILEEYVGILNAIIDSLVHDERRAYQYLKYKRLRKELLDYYSDGEITFNT